VEKKKTDNAREANNCGSALRTVAHCCHGQLVCLLKVARYEGRENCWRPNHPEQVTLMTSAQVPSTMKVRRRRDLTKRFFWAEIRRSLSEVY
jgi:hypothetical protein